MSKKDINIEGFSAKNQQRSQEIFGTDLTPASIGYFIIALTGELGEFANAYKKTVRKFDPGTGRDWADISKEDMAQELADIFLYLDLLASSMGVDLAEAVKKKFNKVSDNLKSNIKIT